MPKPIGGFIGDAGGAYKSVATGVDAGTMDGTGCYQLGEGGHTREGVVLVRVPVQVMFLVDNHADPQGSFQGLPRNQVSGGPMEGHNQYHKPAADHSNQIPQYLPWFLYRTWDRDLHPRD